MLKALETAAAVAGLPEGADLIEPSLGASAFFTGIHPTVIDGIAHLVFYIEQPSTMGGVDYVVVARLVAPEMRAAACLTHAALHIAKGPASIERPAN